MIVAHATGYDRLQHVETCRAMVATCCVIGRVYIEVPPEASSFLSLIPSCQLLTIHSKVHCAIVLSTSSHFKARYLLREPSQRPVHQLEEGGEKQPRPFHLNKGPLKVIQICWAQGMRGRMKMKMKR